MWRDRKQHAKEYGILKNEVHEEEASDGGGALECLHGLYFHFLVPVEDDDGDVGSEEWEGRHVSLKRAITSEGQKHGKVLKGECDPSTCNCPTSLGYWQRPVLQRVKRTQRIRQRG